MAGNDSNKNPQPSKPAVKKIILADKDLGSKANPVKCDRDKGEIEYLEKLKDGNGNPVVYERTGHRRSATGTILDQYEIKSEDGKVCAVIYMSMYCAGHSETKPIKGFQIASGGDPQKTVATPAKATPGQKSQPSSVNTKPTSTQTPTQKPLNETKITDDRIPGFDDVPNSPGKTSDPNNSVSPGIPDTSGSNTGQEDKIPGFDDAPGPSTGKPSASPTTQKPLSQPGKTYISLLPIQDKNEPPKTSSSVPEIPELITKVLTDVFNGLIKKSNAPLTINQKGHTIHDKPKRAGLFFTLGNSTDPDNQKLEKIEKQILTPVKIDIVASAFFSRDEKNRKYKITAIIASKPDQKLFMSKELTYGQDMKTGEIKKDLNNKLINLIQTEFPAILQALPDPTGPTSNPSQTPVYISIIPPDILTDSSTEKPKTLPELLNEVIGKGVKTVVDNNRQLSLNEAHHTIHDSSTPAKYLNEILDRSDLKDNQKTEKIIDEIMTPHGIDCIYTAQFVEMNPGNIVNIHLYAISKARKKIFPTNLIFQKEELICEEAGTQKTIICQAADVNIADAVQALLEQAVK
jgi:hypothetical protein